MGDQANRDSISRDSTSGNSSRRVAVVMGGCSSEREISLLSGHHVAQALTELGHRVRSIDLGPDLLQLLEELNPRPEVVFNALHGLGGEDGRIQSLFEWLGLPYTHSGVLPSALSMNKSLANRLLGSVGIRVPRSKVFSLAQLRIEHPLPLPYVCKPVDDGSSVGVLLVTHDEARRLEGSSDLRLMAEEYIPGRELTVAVIDQQALAVTEIEFEGPIFDYQAKYQQGITRHLLPAPVPSAVYQEALRMALLAHQTLGCRGVTRSDFRYNDQLSGLEGLFFLEINTQPGMTPLSLVPEQVSYVGSSYHFLVEWLVEEAIGRQRAFSVRT